MAVASAPSSFGNLIGQSARMRAVYEEIQRAARINVPVLITGETGTGKELVAEEIHRRSTRREKPFIAVNMGALLPELIPSELFGHVRGSFTGATETKHGRFQEAHGGTLFLDEITTVEERVQVSLLRVLAERRYRRVGGSRDIKTDVRLISATNVDPEVAVVQHRFREDLLHRLQVARIDLPPLRKRRADIKLLAPYFLEVFRQEYGTDVKEISKEAIQVLRLYSWPGNVRELKNAIAQAAINAQSGLIQPDHLPDRIRKAAEQPSMLERMNSLASDGSLHQPQQLHNDALTPSRFPASPFPHHPFPPDGVYMPVGISLDEAEKAFVLKTLASCANNKSMAAKVLGVSRKSLYDKLRRWGLVE